MIDLLRMRALLWGGEDLGAEYEIAAIPAELADAAAAARARLVETVAEHDEGLLAIYLENPDPPAEEILAAVRRLTIARTVTPVLCGSALRNKGVQPLLDAVVDLLPSPADMPPVEGTNPKSGETERREPRIGAPLCALAFKVMTAEDRRLTYLRVYSGRVRAGDTVLNATRSQEEKVARLFRMHANKRERIEEAVAGDIVAAAGLKSAGTGDTLTDPAHPLLLEPMRFTSPVIALAVEPRSSADTDKLAQALGKLAGEDPTLGVRTDPDTGQNIISGMGELHLEIVLDRIDREFRVPVRSGRPQVIHRETISREIESRGLLPARGRRADDAGRSRAADQAARARRGDEDRVRAGFTRASRAGRSRDHRGRQRLLRGRHALGLPDDRPRGCRHQGAFPRGRPVRHGFQDRGRARVSRSHRAGRPAPARADHAA